jgi:hypothetical protein
VSTVACVFVRGYVGYTPDYVKRLGSMVRRNFDGDVEFVVLTDQPKVMQSVADKVITVPTPPHDYPWWAKVELFRPGRFSGRVTYLDLDVLVLRNLNIVTDFPSEFALVPHAGRFDGKNGRRVVKRFNSSVMSWDAGVCDRLFMDYRPEVQLRLWGDQDWIGEQMPHARRMPIEWFPRLSEFDAEKGEVPPDARIVLCKKPKNHQAAAQWKWFAEAWC